VCASASKTDPAGADTDDNFCLTAAMSSLIRLNGCTDSDTDFDGPEYANNWPGTLANHRLDRLLHGTPIRFTSPLIRGVRNYERIAFETDLPRIEGTQGCNRVTGANCTNPPAGASFYPIFTTGGGGSEEDDRNDQGCVWREGGPLLANTNPGNFTNSHDEYDGLVQLVYPGPGFSPIFRFNDFRRVVATNPCPAQRLDD
jgi:hypothetical protein